MVDILVVDDELDLREMICDLLEDHGFSTHGATDGRAALTWLTEQPRPPKIIILDAMMPRMDGPSFRAELLKDPALADIPVILMTAAVNADQIASNMGVTHLLRKPVRTDAILWAIREFIPKSVQPTG
jgi:CheY-like chemotaxis protein